MADIRIDAPKDYIVKWLMLSTQALIDTEVDLDHKKAMESLYDERIKELCDFAGVGRWDPLPELRVDEDGNVVSEGGKVVSMAGEVVA